MLQGVRPLHFIFWDVENLTWDACRICRVLYSRIERDPQDWICSNLNSQVCKPDPHDEDGEEPAPLALVETSGSKQRGLDLLNASPGVFKALAPGSHKKRLPVRCLACSSVYAKDVVFDMISNRRESYVRQHTETQRHQDALTQFSAGPGDPPDHEGQDDHKPSGTMIAKENIGQDDPAGDGDGSDDGGEGEAGGKRARRLEPCMGFRLHEFPQTRVGQLQEEFAWWYQHTSLDSPWFKPHTTPQTEEAGEVRTGHRYCEEKEKGDTKSKVYKIFHRLCDGKVDGHGNKCKKLCRHCWSIRSDKGIIRNVTRFWVKWWSAKLLKARLYKQFDQVDSLVSEATNGAVAQLCQAAAAEMQKVCKYSVLELIGHVRFAWLSFPVYKRNEAQKFLIGSLVQPCVKVNHHNIRRGDLESAELLARSLTEGRLSDVNDVDLKLACFVGSGALRSHPMIHGILIMMIEKIRREHRGVHTMKHLQLSDAEKLIVSEAGIALSLAACNKQMFKQFGMLRARARVDLCKLLERSVPDPFLSISDSRVLWQNGFLVDSMFPKKEGWPNRRLHLAFDKTYLLKQVSVLKHRLGKGLAGTAWRLGNLGSLAGLTEDEQRAKVQKAISGCLKAMPSEEQEEKNPKLNEELCDFVESTSIDYANEMADFVCWDPCNGFQGRPRFSLAAVPMSYECDAREMLHLVGTVMRDTGALIKSVVFDNHSTHRLIKQALLGSFAAPPDVPFFGELEYDRFPPTCLRNFEFRMPVFKGEHIWCLNGPLHIAKNTVGKMRADNRTSHTSLDILDFVRIRFVYIDQHDQLD